MSLPYLPPAPAHTCLSGVVKVRDRGAKISRGFRPTTYSPRDHRDTSYLLYALGFPSSQFNDNYDYNDQNRVAMRW